MTTWYVLATATFLYYRSFLPENFQRQNSTFSSVEIQPIFVHKHNYRGTYGVRGVGYPGRTESLSDGRWPGYPDG